jgi:O-antigen ligase
VKRLPGITLILYSLTGTISIAASQAVMALGAGLALVDRGRGIWFRWVRTGLERPLVFWALASVFATALAADPMASADKLRKIPLLAMVFWAPAVIDRPWALGRLYTGLLFSAGATALYGVLTFFLQGGPELSIRLRGFHTSYVTNSGLLLLCTFPAVLFAGCRELSASRRWGAAFAAGSILAAQFFGRLATGWLGTAAGLFFLALRRGRPRLAALVPLAAALLLVLPGVFQETARNLLDPTGAANQRRVDIWANGLQLFRGDPWSGWGLHDLSDEYRRVKDPSDPTEGHMSSVPVHVAASMGLPGVLALVWLTVAFFRVIARARRKVETEFLRAVVDGTEASLVAFLTAGLVDWNLGDSELLALLCFLVGTAIAAGRLGPAERTTTAGAA